jgi:hypothetical protein
VKVCLLRVTALEKLIFSNNELHSVFNRYQMKSLNSYESRHKMLIEQESFQIKRSMLQSDYDSPLAKKI